MSYSNNSHSLEELIADYLNGHLSDADTQKLETAMAEDLQFRDMIKFECRIQSSVCLERAAPTHVPQFATLADKLDGGSRTITSRWRAWGPSFAVVMLVAIAVGYFPQSEQPINEFETLSDIPFNYAKSVLRIIQQDTIDEAALTDLLRDYDLTLVKRYPGANVLDAIPNTPSQLESIAKQLEKDQRVKFVQIPQGSK